MLKPYEIMATVYPSSVKTEYLSLLIFLVISLLLTSIIMLASYFLARQNPDVEKLSAYECGFEPYEDARQAFDVKFFVTAILFIVFDVEIMFLTPWCILVSKLDPISYWAMMDFLLELGVGYFYVWYANALDWS